MSLRMVLSWTMNRSDDDSVNGEVEYCPPNNDFLVIAELDRTPIEEGPI